MKGFERQVTGTYPIVCLIRTLPLREKDKNDCEDQYNKVMKKVTSYPIKDLRALENLSSSNQLRLSAKARTFIQ